MSINERRLTIRQLKEKYKIRTSTVHFKIKTIHNELRPLLPKYIKNLEYNYDVQYYIDQLQQSIEES